MPLKSGIDVLRDLSDDSDFDCHVVFQTGCEKYTIETLRETAFDYIMKPVERPVLSNMVNRFLNMKYKQGFREKFNTLPAYVCRIPLPTADGLCFIQPEEIVAIEYFSHEEGTKPFWAILTCNHRKIALRRKIKGQAILGQLNSDRFFMINSGSIINLDYLSEVDYKTRNCLMAPPFDKLKYLIARNKMARFKERFDNLM